MKRVMADEGLREWIRTRGRPHVAMLAGFPQSGETPDPDWMLEPPLEAGTVISNDIRVGLAYAQEAAETRRIVCLLYTSDAADE